MPHPTNNHKSVIATVDKLKKEAEKCKDNKE